VLKKIYKGARLNLNETNQSIGIVYGGAFVKDNVVIGIDTGSSSTKLSMFDLEGRLIRESSFSMQLDHPAKDQAELNLTQLFQNIMNHLKELINGYEQRVQGIGLSVASPTLVFFNRQLEALRPGIAYFDNRSLKEVTQAVERFGGSNMYFARVGNNPSPSTCVAATINWVRSHEPEVWEDTLQFGFLNSYLGVQLTGRLAVEPTVSSYSGLVRVRKPLEWEPRFMEIFDLDEDYMPEMISSTARLGGLKKEIAAELNLPEGTPVALGAADTAASSLAMGVRRHGDIFQTMGTSEVAVVCLNNPNFSPAFMNRSHVIPGLWLSNGAMSMSGGSIRWFIQTMAPELKNEQELEALAMTSVPGANGVIFVPYLCGERSPMFDPRARGMFFGLTSSTTKADLARAVYEGLGYAMQQIYQIGTERWDVHPPYVVCIGGATKSPLSLEIRANMQNVTIRTVETSNAATFGAAMMGGMAGDAFGGIWDLPVVENYRTYVDPDPEKVLFYSRFREIYKQIYPNLVEQMHQLHDLTHETK